MPIQVSFFLRGAAIIFAFRRPYNLFPNTSKEDCTVVTKISSGHVCLVYARICDLYHSRKGDDEHDFDSFDTVSIQHDAGFVWMHLTPRRMPVTSPRRYWKAVRGGRESSERSSASFICGPEKFVIDMSTLGRASPILAGASCWRSPQCSHTRLP